MGKLTTLKLSPHARQRLEERKTGDIIYNTRNLMRSSCKWYAKDDLIEKSKLYQHSLYVCRKSTQLGYITDGEVEVLYNKSTGVAITVMEFKEKFKPVTQYVKPEILEAIEIKKESKKMKKLTGTCPDCGTEDVVINSQGICNKCRQRKANAKMHGREYIPYLKLTPEQRHKIDMQRESQLKRINELKEESIKDIPIPEIHVAENYYQVKAENNPNIAIMKTADTEDVENVIEETEDTAKETVAMNPSLTEFIDTLRNCGCEIEDKNLSEILKVLLATDTMKDVIMTIVDNKNQQALLDLEQILNVAERKLQHVWEYNGFKEEDDRKFKDFLTWRRTLKGAMFFWKKLYQSNTLIEMQRAWNAYTADPNEKIVMARDKEKTTSPLKRFQITTETISTIYNTRREFTRVFYAISEEEAHDKFVKWLAERQLHENKTKTTIVDLSNEGERV